TAPVNVSRRALFGLKLRASLGYLVEYCYFTVACLLVTTYVFVRRGFDVIHAHNPPDTLFVVAIPFKLLGKKFVFDHHDLCPELYRSRYKTQEGFYTELLRLFEWCSLKLADVVIATNESYKKVETERAHKDPRNIFVVRNGPNQMRMTPVAPSLRLRGMNKCILCYVGSLNPQDGVDYLLQIGLFEWCSLKLADVVIATNESYKKVETERAHKDPRNIFVVRNGPNQMRMTPVAPSLRLRGMNKCILCYVGSLNPQDGVDYLL